MDIEIKELDIRQQIAEESGSNYSIILIGNGYYSVALNYLFLGGEKNIKFAIEYFKRSIEIYEKAQDRLLSIHYAQCAKYIADFGGSNNLSFAWELYIKALKSAMNLFNTSDFTHEVSACFRDISEFYIKHSGQVSLQNEQNLYTKAITLSEQHSKASHSNNSYNELSDIYYYVAMIYKEIGGNENLKLSLEYYRKGIAILYQITDELGIDDIIIKLSEKYYKIADSFKAIGDDENLLRALTIYIDFFLLLYNYSKGSTDEHCLAVIHTNMIVICGRIEEIYKTVCIRACDDKTRDIIVECSRIMKKVLDNMLEQ